MRKFYFLHHLFFGRITPPPVEELAEDFEMEVGDDQSMSVDWSI